MALLFKRQINENTLLGVWKLNESVDFFFENLNLSENEYNYISDFKNENRKKQWLAARLITKKLLPVGFAPELYYDDNGKPHFVHHNFQVSLSHSSDLVASIISKKHLLGIDIEKLQTRILKLGKRFLNKEEYSQLIPGKEIENLYIYWGAKEALYKLYGKKELIFNENIILDPVYDPVYNGSFKGKISINDFNKEFEIFFEKIEGHMLVYVSNANQE